MRYTHLWFELLNAEYDQPARAAFNESLARIVGSDGPTLATTFYGENSDFLYALRSAWLDVKTTGPEASFVEAVNSAAGDAIGGDPLDGFLAPGSITDADALAKAIIKSAAIGFATHVHDELYSVQPESVERCMGMAPPEDAEELQAGVDRRLGDRRDGEEDSPEGSERRGMGLERRGSEELIKNASNLPSGFELWANDQLATKVLGASPSPIKFQRCAVLHTGSEYGNFCSHDCQDAVQYLSRRLFDSSYHKDKED